MSEIVIRGISETIQTLYKIDKTLGRKITRAALRNGANLLLKEARRQAPKGQSGRLRRSLRLSNNRKFNPKRNGKIGFSIKHRKGKSRTDRRGAYYSHMIIGGHYNTGHQKLQKGVRYSRTKGKDYITKAYYIARTPATRLAIRNIESGGKQLIRKLKK